MIHALLLWKPASGCFVDRGKMVVLRLVAAAKFQIQKFHSHAHPIPASFMREANQVADGLAKESTKLIL